MNVIIVGGGQVGSYLADLLLKDGHKITVVEERPKQLALLKNEMPEGTIVAGGFTDPVVLESAGIAKTDVVVAVTAKDEDNLVISTLAKFEFGVPRVIARVNNPKNSWVFTPEMGIDVGLNEADVMAHLVAEEMSLGDMITIMKLNKGKHSLVQEKVHPKSAVVGKTLRDLSLPVECVIFGVIRHSDLVIPRGDTVLEANDEILAVSHVSQVKALAQMLAPIQ